MAVDRVFEIIGKIENTEIIAVGGSVQSREWLRTEFGPGKWRKMKGQATVRYSTGRIARAELHWYEAHGIGKVDIKVKQEL